MITTQTQLRRTFSGRVLILLIRKQNLALKILLLSYFMFPRRLASLNHQRVMIKYQVIMMSQALCNINIVHKKILF